jgi:hypothetical protein
VADVVAPETRAACPWRYGHVWADPGWSGELPVQPGVAAKFPWSPECHPGPDRGRMYDVLSALIPPAVVGGAFVYGAFKLLRSEGAGRRSAKQSDQAESQNS